MTVVLKLDTKPSLFNPIEVEIDGKIFRVKDLTLGSLERIQELQSALNEGSATAIRGILELLMEGEVSLLKDLSFRKIQKLIRVIVEKSMTAEDEEKNESGPGLVS